MTIFSGVVTTRRLTISLLSIRRCSRFIFSVRCSISSNTLSSGMGIFMAFSNTAPTVFTPNFSKGNTFSMTPDRRSGYFSSASVSPVGAQSTIMVSYSPLSYISKILNMENSSSNPGKISSSSASIPPPPLAVSNCFRYPFKFPQLFSPSYTVSISMA